MHLNVNGVIAKKYKLSKMLQELNPSVIGLSETHLKNDMELTIAGYEWAGENNQDAIRGSRGVGLLVQNGIDFKIIKHNSLLIE